MTWFKEWKSGWLCVSNGRLSLVAGPVLLDLRRMWDHPREWDFHCTECCWFSIDVGFFELSIARETCSVLRTQAAGLRNLLDTVRLRYRVPLYRRVAQLAEHTDDNRAVAGSTPAVPTTLKGTAMKKENDHE